MVTPLIVVINIIMFVIYHVCYEIVLIVYRFVRKSQLKIGYFMLISSSILIDPLICNFLISFKLFYFYYRCDIFSFFFSLDQTT